MRRSHRFTYSLLIVVACCVALASFTNNESRAHVDSSTLAHGAMPVLNGQPAEDYLKREGLFDRVRGSVEASQYAIKWQGQTGIGAHQAANPGQNLRASFTADGVQFAPLQSSKNSTARQIRMKLQSVGYGKQVSELVSGPMKVAGNRVEILHAKVSEWYVNKPEGIEQGFTLAKRPGLNVTSEPLRVTLTLNGDLEAKLEDDGQAVIFSQRDGKQVWRYDHLVAFDGLGRSLAARMELSAGEISLLVDDSNAFYPVTIDPIFTEVQKLTASDASVDGQFGWSIGISGDTVVVGALNGGSPTFGGAAYIFERNKGGAENWGEVKKLTVADGGQFGVSVGISGDTVVVGSWLNSNRTGAAYVFERNKGGADVWGEVKKLTASEGAALDMFGVSVGISDDTIVVAAHRDESGRGSAYVFERNKGGVDFWGEVKKLIASDGGADDQLGRWVAIDNDTVVAGANGDESARGSAYVFERNKGGADNWGEVRKLTPSDGAAADQFGRSVGISDDTLVVGAPIHASDRGAGYVYERNKGGADNWGEVRKLIASDAATNEFLGFSVGISGDTVVAGAPQFNVPKGSAYTYQRNQGGADNWGEVKKLTPSDGGAEDQFGWSVAISGDTIAIGAQRSDSFRGAAYTFASQNCEQWVEQRKPTASDGEAPDRFGYSVAISGDTVVVGAFRDDAFKGSAYIYERNKSGPELWGEVKKLTASDGTAADWFGHSVMISGDTVVVGAHMDDSSKGAAYIYERNKGGADNWGEIKKLTASDGGANDFFGYSVGISGDTVVAGAHRDVSGMGSTYIFERNKGGADNWGEIRRVTATDGASADNLGRSVAISGDMIVAGASGDDSAKGSAYLFERNKGGADLWGEVRKMSASDGVGGDFFGYSVGISGSTVVVGAVDDDSGKGGVYVFERNKGGADLWGEVKKLTASDGAASDGFSSVWINGDTVIVGANGDDSSKGAAYVFERNKGGADNWGEVQKLTASDGAANDFFGFALGISGDTVVVGAFNRASAKGSSYIFVLNCPDFAATVSVSAASYLTETALAPEMIVAAFGVNLATGLGVGSTIPLPTNLNGTTVSVRDSAGMERLAQLFFVSPGQVNYYIPAGTSNGPATVKITSGSGQISVGMVEIATISPGFFTANYSGGGISAALALRVRGTQQTYEQISMYDFVTNSIVPIPVDLGPAGDDVYLIMYGTGFRFRTGDNGVSVRVGGRTLQSLYSGMAEGFIGLDQLNISPLPRTLAGAGVVNIDITVDGKTANTTTVSIK